MSLIEILVLIAVLAVLLTISMPLYRVLGPKIELDNAYQEAIASLRQAQYQALETQNSIAVDVSIFSLVSSYDFALTTFSPQGTPDNPNTINFQYNGKTKTIQISSSGYIR